MEPCRRDSANLRATSSLQVNGTSDIQSLTNPPTVLETHPVFRMRTPDTTRASTVPSAQGSLLGRERRTPVLQPTSWSFPKSLLRAAQSCSLKPEIISCGPSCIFPTSSCADLECFGVVLNTDLRGIDLVQECTWVMKVYSTRSQLHHTLTSMHQAV